jgi:hypothetical protein
LDVSRLNAFGVQLASQGLHVADCEVTTCLLRVPTVDRQTDLSAAPLQNGRLPILRDQREAEHLRVIPDRRPDLLHRHGIRIRVADGIDAFEDNAL